MCDQQRLRSACAFAQSDQSLCLSLEYSLTVNLLTDHHLGFVSLTGGCTGSSESTHVKTPHCWRSHVTAHISTASLTVVAKYTTVIFGVVKLHCYLISYIYVNFISLKKYMMSNEQRTLNIYNSMTQGQNL